ncbi:MAG TPA: hypothetical protein VHH11_11960 [Gammaproteobacteria bacterium]|nr:hypothetical protein [Gammaproteobacteria bacterium]
MRESAPLLRTAVHATFSLMWLVGAALFVLKHFFESKVAFGPHPWQPPLTQVHGILAVLATFLFGWIVAAQRAQPQRQRATAPLLFVTLAWLVVTGFALFFLVSEEWRGVDATLHEFVGLAFLLPWLAYLAGAARRPG